MFRKILLTAFACFAFSMAQTPGAAPVWAGSWAASQQLPDLQNAMDPEDLRNATLRQIVHLSIGGSALRVHLSNAFGTAPLRLSSVHIARPVSVDSPAIVPNSDKALAFHGSADVIIPPGAEFISDPVDMAVAPLSDWAISIHYDESPAQQTGHPGSRATSYLAHGDLTAALDMPSSKKVEHWYQISGVDVAVPVASASIVALGDSITDGHGATVNGNDRWPDVLARRLQQARTARDAGVLNEGIGGNRLLNDGIGPNALARFDRDVLAQTGVRYLIILEGVNDLGGLARAGNASAAEHAALVQRVIAAYEQMIARAHAHGIRVIGGTILPYTGSDFYHPGPTDESDRKAVNDWIRTPGHFDAVIDFDRIMADPQHPERLFANYDSGDHLHPSPAGYAAMGEAVPLNWFARR